MSALVTTLALDLGLATGWVIHLPGGQIVSGTQSFKPCRFEGGGMRYLRFRRWLTETKATTDGIDAVYFEEVGRHACACRRQRGRRAGAASLGAEVIE